MKDYLNNEIKINDEVIFLAYMRTGSSSSRNMIAKGKVIGFDKKKVKIKVEYYDTDKWKPNIETIENIIPLKIVVIGGKNE